MLKLSKEHMLITRNQAFLELLERSFGAMSPQIKVDALNSRFESINNEIDFDLYLWSLAHQLKVDSEELLRQLGERWALDLLNSDLSLSESKESLLQTTDYLLSRTEHLSKAPIVGADAFRAVVVARGQESIRVCCLGARRCCSFLEGVVRGFGRTSGESVRYMRQPQNATMVEILFKTFDRV